MSALREELFEALPPLQEGRLRRTEEKNYPPYLDIENSLLHRVLETGRGLPILLSVVWMAAAREIGLPCSVTARLPGSVLIRVHVDGGKDPLRDVYVDTFSSGKHMAWEELREFASRQVGATAVPPDEYVKALVARCPPAEVYARMVRNVVGALQEREDAVRLLEFLERGGPVSPLDALQEEDGGEEEGWVPFGSGKRDE